MKSTRRGFFATLAALPAVVRGTKTIATAGQTVYGGPDHGGRVTVKSGMGTAFSKQPYAFVINAQMPNVADVRRSLRQITTEYEQHTGRRLGS